MATTAAGSPGWALHLRLGDVPVRVELGFFVVAALLGASLGTIGAIAIWVAVVLVSVLVHELGHAVAMRLSGVSARIVLHGMGGLTIPAASIASRPKRIVVDLAGPVAALVLLGVPGAWLARTLDDPGPTVEIALLSIVWVNVAWSLVNLLPILPLDGGNVTKELLDVATDGHGEVPARVVSILVAGAAGLYALRSGLLFAGMFAVFFLAMNWRALADRRSARVGDEVRQAYAAVAGDDPDRALALVADALPQAKAVDLRAVAVEVAAWAHVARGEDAEARRALGRMPSQREASGHLQCVLADPQVVSRADRVNLTVDDWVAEDCLLPPPVYVRRLAAAGLLDDVVDRLLASRAEAAPRGRHALRQLLLRAGRYDEVARFGPPEPPPDRGPT